MGSSDVQMLITEIRNLKERLNEDEAKISAFYDMCHSKSTDDIAMCEDALAELGDIIYAE